MLIQRRFFTQTILSLQRKENDLYISGKRGQHANERLVRTRLQSSLEVKGRLPKRDYYSHRSHVVHNPDNSLNGQRGPGLARSKQGGVHGPSYEKKGKLWIRKKRAQGYSCTKGVWSSDSVNVIVFRTSKVEAPIVHGDVRKVTRVVLVLVQRVQIGWSFCEPTVVAFQPQKKAFQPQKKVAATTGECKRERGLRNNVLYARCLNMEYTIEPLHALGVFFFF